MRPVCSPCGASAIKGGSRDRNNVCECDIIWLLLRVWYYLITMTMTIGSFGFALPLRLLLLISLVGEAQAVTCRNSIPRLLLTLLSITCSPIWSITRPRALSATRSRLQAAGAHPLPTGNQSAMRHFLRLIAPNALLPSSTNFWPCAALPSVLRVNPLNVPCATSSTSFIESNDRRVSSSNMGK